MSLHVASCRIFFYAIATQIGVAATMLISIDNSVATLKTILESTAAFIFRKYQNNFVGNLQEFLFWF